MYEHDSEMKGRASWLQVSGFPVVSECSGVSCSVRMDHTYKNIYLWNHAWGFLPVLLAFLKLKKRQCKLM